MRWENSTLGNLTVLITKGTTPSNIGCAFEDSGINYIRSEMITSSRRISDSGMLYISEETHNKLNRSKLCEDDILFSMAGAYLGKTALLRVRDIPANTNQAVALIRLDKNKCIPEFVYYFLNLPQTIAYVNQINSQSAQPNINLQQIGNIPISVPGLTTQRSISAVLSAYDDLIENNQQQIKLLEEAAQRLYKEWFVDLHFPGYEQTTIVDGVPEGWTKGYLKELISVNYGKDHKQVPNNGDIPVYGSGGIMRKCDRALFEGEAVLVPRKGSLNNIMYVNGPFWTVDTMFYATMKQEHTALFVYFYLSSYDMYAMNIGAAVPSMTVKILDAMDVLIPSAKELEKYDTLVRKYFERIWVLHKQNELLTEARDRLLPKLMSGEVEV